MRKHFLILMLMALLPLSGFATITVSNQPALVDPASSVYNGSDVTPVVSDGVATGSSVDYDWYYAAVKGEDQAPAMSAENTWFAKGDLKIQNAGVYYIYYKVVPHNATDEAPYGPIGVGTYTITQATLSAYVDEEHKNDYKLPTKIDGTYTTAAQQLINAGTVYTTNAGSFTYTLDNASYTEAADVKGTNAKVYTVKYTLSGSENYAPVEGTIDVTISAKEIDAAWITAFNGATTKRTYGDEWNEPTFTVSKFNNDNVSYDVLWFDNTANLDDDAKAVNPTAAAGTYYAKIKGNGNYSGSVKYTVSTREWKFDVDQRKLNIIVNPQTKEYNGQEQAATVSSIAEAFTITNLAEADENKTITGLSIVKVNDETVKNVGDYKMKASVAVDAKIGDDFLSKNYTFNILTAGYLRITPKALSVEILADKEISYGDALPTPTTLYVGATYYNATEAAAYNTENVDADKLTTAEGLALNSDISDTQAAAFAAEGLTGTDYEVGHEITQAVIDAYYEAIGAKRVGDVKVAGHVDEQVTITGILIDPGHAIDETEAVASALTLGLKAQEDAHYYDNANTYSNCWVVTYETDNDNVATATALKNYTIDLTQASKTFKINGAGYTIMVTGAQKTYDGQDATNATGLGYLAFNDNNDEVKLPSNVEVVYEFFVDDQWTTTKPTEVSNYKYRVKADPAYNFGNYTGEIKYEEATLKIKAKKIKVIVNEISLHDGDNAAQLNKYAKFTVDPTTPLVKDANNKDEELNLYYSFNDVVTVTGVTNGIWDNTNSKLKYNSETPANNTVADAVTARLVTAADYEEHGIYENQTPALKCNAHYELESVTDATLTILPGTSLAFDVNDHILDKLQDAVSTEDATVTFDNTQYVVPAGEWRTFVLPFDITPLEFCNATGIEKYCIFNKLTSANASTNTVRFSLEQKNLPANEPFLVKVAKLTDAADEVGFDLDNVTFGGRTIAAYQENPTATVSQAKFIGSWVDKNIEGGDNKMWWDNASGNFVAATKGGVAKAFPNFCFHAYLVLDESFNANEARILVEEADGSITAINYVTGEQQNFAKGAWYTINGVKVNGIPTEKGIYINNGKKVVIK